MTDLTSPENARRRLREVLRGHDRFLYDLEDIGGAAIFGGAARDLLTMQPREFDRDVDIVVDGDPEELAAVCSRYGAQRNRFGGYRVLSGSRPFDVWALSNTWAFAEGFSDDRSLTGLCRTTYFSSDSIVYDLKEGKLHHSDGYWENIRRRRIDLVLPQNPNPLGAVLRTMTFAMVHGFALSFSLARHTFDLSRSFSKSEWSLLASGITRGQRTQAPTYFWGCLASYVESESAEDFWFQRSKIGTAHQLELHFPDASRPLKPYR